MPPAPGVRSRYWREAVQLPDAAARGGGAIIDRVVGLSGAIFVGAGLVKFIWHGWELHAFRAFGLPAPGVWVIIAGVLEVAGGGLLLARRLVAPAACALALTMAVAIAVSGVGHGDVLPSLTLAPALLLAMLYILLRVLGTARRAEDRRGANP